MKVLETGIDDLVEYLKKREETSVEDLSEALGYPEDIIEEWAKVLDEHEIVDVDYGFTSTKVKIKEHEEDQKDMVKEKLKKDKEEKFICNECGRSFETERGLQTHKGMMHKGD